MLKSVLAGFPDRVARLRTGNQVLLSTGASAEVKGQPPQYEFMVALDAEDRRDKPQPLVRMTARIEPEWLIDLFPDRMREQSTVQWNRSTERVDAVSMLLYDELILQESRGAAPAPEAAAELLAQKADGSWNRTLCRSRETSISPCRASCLPVLSHRIFSKHCGSCVSDC